MFPHNLQTFLESLPAMQYAAAPAENPKDQRRRICAEFLQSRPLTLATLTQVLTPLPRTTSDQADLFYTMLEVMAASDTFPIPHAPFASAPLLFEQVGHRRFMNYPPWIFPMLDAMEVVRVQGRGNREAMSRALGRFFMLNRNTARGLVSKNLQPRRKRARETSDDSDYEMPPLKVPREELPSKTTKTRIVIDLVSDPEDEQAEEESSEETDVETAAWALVSLTPAAPAYVF